MCFYRLVKNLAYFFCICGALSCNKPHEKGMFEIVSPGKSKIAFENKPKEGHLFNILYYLYYYNGAGVATGDINNDGFTDIYFTANNQGGNKLYLNKKNFVFEDITEAAGVKGSADWNT